MTIDREPSRDHSRKERTLAMQTVLPPSSKAARLLFGAMALLLVLSGLAIYLVSDHLGIPTQTAKWLAAIMLVVGLADYVLLLLWDRIFTRTGPSPEA
ncbi:MAG: hypothetical protein KDJ41_11440 [Hyphomicrobiaceae bacterium]|nr:hypothetical protein [Hyphomicrobiaceae bacterium]